MTVDIPAPTEFANTSMTTTLSDVWRGWREHRIRYQHRVVEIDPNDQAKERLDERAKRAHRGRSA